LTGSGSDFRQRLKTSESGFMAFTHKKVYIESFLKPGSGSGSGSGRIRAILVGSRSGSGSGTLAVHFRICQKHVCKNINLILYSVLYIPYLLSCIVFSCVTSGDPECMAGGSSGQVLMLFINKSFS
jgi:hypothetical protein